MDLYSEAMYKVEDRINSLNEDYRDIYEADLVNHVMCRIKKPESIIKKMKKKNYELTYQNLIEKVNDIAGVRIVCPFKSDVFEVVEIIRELDDFRVIKEKDYITTPKKTGYSSYHVILEVPVKMDNTTLYAKVEVQIRTMAMDFWSTLEHELKYKSKEKISNKFSKELVLYAKIINKLDNKFMKVRNKGFDDNFKLIN